jgi:NTP pyrophosphatase (non-canonical NTP hydrolase)
MTDPSTIAELTDVAHGLGFEVTCYSGGGGVRLCGNEVHFGGTVQECAAFLVGWGTLRSRLLGELRAIDGQVPPEMSGQQVSSSSGVERRGAEFWTRGSAPGSPAVRSGERGAGEGMLSRWLPRDQRQAMIVAWAQMAFGHEEATGIPHRGLRLLEEAIEVFQACGGDAEIAHELVTFIFKRPCGTINQELGGVAVSLLALAAAAGLSADEEERREVHRVLSKPLAEPSSRNVTKNTAGFKISGAGSLVRRSLLTSGAGVRTSP